MKKCKTTNCKATGKRLSSLELQTVNAGVVAQKAATNSCKAIKRGDPIPKECEDYFKALKK